MKTLLSNKNLSRKKERKKSIHSIPLALRRYDLYSWSSHTQLQQTAILLGCTSPKLLCKYDKALTFSNTKPQPPPAPGPYHPSPTPMAAPPPRIPNAKYVNVLSSLTKKNCSSVTCVILV